jgi:glycosyltransferase involved in cell wall biosynthesis
MSKIAFQGELGANSHIACHEVYPDLEPMPCPTFEDVFQAAATGEAQLAMIPVENSIAGRVADIHHLLPTSPLQIIAEHFMPIRFQLMGLRGSSLQQIKAAHSHIMGLGQCRNFLRARGILARTSSDTAGAAREVRDLGDPTQAAIAPRLAAEVYGHHHALVITSSWETGPIVAWQAMASGMAVVSSRYVGAGLEGALEHDATALLFPCGDTDAAAGELARLREPALLERLSRVVPLVDDGGLWRVAREDDSETGE